MRIDVVEQPKFEPVTLAEAKLDMRIVLNREDTLIAARISAARDYVERTLGYAVALQKRRATLDAFCTPIKLLGYSIAVTEVKYTDADGNEQVLDEAAYTVDASGGRACIAPAYGMSWPATRKQSGAVRIEFTDGKVPDDVPHTIKAAIRLITADLNENREGTVIANGITVAVSNPNVDMLLLPHQVITP